LQSQEEIKKRLSTSLDKMPSLPTTVGKVIQLAHDINSSAKDILAVIQMDPVLAAKVLKLIHSAFYGMSDKVTLKQAVVLLGINTIKNLALSSAIVGQMGKSTVKIKTFDPHRYWQHCLATGIASRIICKKLHTDPQEVDEFFVAGLVHDIGKLVLALGIPMIYAKTLHYAKTNSLNGVESELKIIGMDHAEVGCLLARKWSLSEELVDTILYHHEPEKKNGRLTWVVHAANYFAQKKGYVNAGEFGQSVLNSKSGEFLGLSEAEMEASLANLSEEIEKAAVFLQT
jgi:putative nucleotidyltransferase with HDIG domain